MCCLGVLVFMCFGLYVVCVVWGVGLYVLCLFCFGWSLGWSLGVGLCVFCLGWSLDWSLRVVFDVLLL